MENKTICFECDNIEKKITVESNNGDKQQLGICSKTKGKVFAYLKEDECGNFERKQNNNKKEVCYLFSEEEWEAIRNGTYVGITKLH